ncbi:hypothetical protein LTR36_008597 [Oleoguttula mirabilis]|uniref:Major facilitator superfamily (MFS) profile domain-containing protein n=1 Tax=Oleoguttula mirabilis TaxID=1507867 RepID=A0AAV9JTH9_9PEZI|nr:hypothetical protein LTR36_008597 [Oleoguttula mirabilis]
MAFYKMDTPAQSTLSLVSKTPDWDSSAPPSRDSWRPFNVAHQANSTTVLTALPESPQSTPQPSPRFAPEPPPGPPKGPPGGPPPDGGLTAWLQVLGGYFIFFNTWGLINAFGVFQTYYSGELLTNQSNSTISWIGTFTSFLLCASPISWGPIFDMGSPRLLVLFGSFCVVFGLMLTSLCHEYWQLMITQGVVVGLGGGCLFITATSILPSYFSKKRALVMGLSASGSSLGGIVYPILFHQLQPKVGFGWTVRFIGFIALATLAVPCAVIKPRAKPPGRRKIFDLSIVKEVPYSIFNLATFFGFVGQYIPFFFIIQFASEHGMTKPFYMLIFLNVGSIPGRILPSLLADRYFNPLHVLATCTGCATILAFCWIAITESTAGLIGWCFLYGFCSGAFVSLQGAAVASMTTNMSTIGTRFGINMFCGALGILIGAPVGAAIFPYSWPGAQTFCGVSLGCSTACIVATWIAFERSKQRGQSKLEE